MALHVDLENYRRWARADRKVAESTGLANVRERALRSAERWDELATRADRAIASAAKREGVDT